MLAARDDDDDDDDDDILNIYIYIYTWRLSIVSDDDVCVLHRIYNTGGDSAAPAKKYIVLNSGGTGSKLL